MTIGRRAFLGAMAGAATMVALPSRGSATCPAPRVFASLVTPLGARLPRDAALLATIESGYSPLGPRAQWSDDRGATLNDAALAKGASRIPLRAETIGGGLVRLVPASTPDAGEYRLEGWDANGGGPPNEPPTLAFGGASPAPPTAVEVLRVRHTEQVGPERMWGRARSWDTTLTLDRPLPPGIVRAFLAPAGFGGWVEFEVPRGGTELRSRGTEGGTHCGDSRPGRSGASRGLRGHLVLVDAQGRSARARGETWIR